MVKKLLVCGATGFIGRNVAEYFAQNPNFEVYGTYLNSKPYHNDKISLIKSDLTKREDVNRVVKGMDVIVHMAATTSGAKDIVSRPYIHVSDNAIMSHFLLRAAFDNNVKHFIFPSCSIVYPSWNKNPVKENDIDLEKIDKKYFGAAWMKIGMEKACEFFSRLGRTKHTVFRHSNVYGPYDKYDLERSHVFGATVTKVMQAKRSDNIDVWGKGVEERDLIYVSDIVSFIEKAIEKQDREFELVNIGLGESISIKNLVEKIIKLSKKEDIGIKFHLDKPTIETKVALDYSLAKKIFGWQPEISLEEGIKKTIQWYRENVL